MRITHILYQCRHPTYGVKIDKSWCLIEDLYIVTHVTWILSCLLIEYVHAGSLSKDGHLWMFFVDIAMDEWRRFRHEKESIAPENF